MPTVRKTTASATRKPRMTARKAKPVESPDAPQERPEEYSTEPRTATPREQALRDALHSIAYGHSWHGRDALVQTARKALDAYERGA